MMSSHLRGPTLCNRDARPGGLFKELRHVIGIRGCPRIGLYPQPLKHQAKRVLVLIKSGGLVRALRPLRADSHPCDPSASVSVIAGRLVKNDNKQSAILEG